VSPLRFAFLTTFYPPYHFGGDAIAVQRLARALVSRGHAVTVLHDVDAYMALHQGAEPPPAESDGVEVIPLRSGLGALSPMLTQQLGRPVLNGGRIRRLLAQRRPDVVHFHNISLVGGPALLDVAGNAATLYSAHEHWLVCPTHVLWRHRREPCPARECLRCQLRYHRPPQLWRWTGMLDRRLARVDAFIAMSEFSRRKHMEFGFGRDMEVIPPFLPDGGPAEVGPSPHPRPYFLYAGRLEQLKGLDDVIPRFAGDAGPDLLIAGDGTHGPALRALATGMPRVRFLGRLGAGELPRYYAHAVALIAPTLGYETFGMTLIEAFRERTPVLARRTGPYPEIVSLSGGGELFTTAAELALSMDRLLADPAYRALLAASGSAAVEARWTESAVMPRYLELVDRIRGGRSTPAREVA
jgi:glycosyltransferase involved in cell wall biosynthesis